MNKLRTTTAIFLIVLAASAFVGVARAQAQSCEGKVVEMWQRHLNRAVDEITQGYLDGKTSTDGLQGPLSDVVAYSVYLIPCVQSMGKEWDPSMRLLIYATQKESLSGDELAHRLLLLRLREAGADTGNIDGLWEGRRFKLIP